VAQLQREAQFHTATPDALASGPTMPDSTSVEDCRRIVEKHNLLPQFPNSVRELFERDALDATRIVEADVVSK
jgi:glycerate-2-kinase